MFPSWAWWSILVILPIRGLRKKNVELEGSLGSILRTCVKKKNKNQKKNSRRRLRLQVAEGPWKTGLHYSRIIFQIHGSKDW
jgi:hypothetical protein